MTGLFQGFACGKREPNPKKHPEKTRVNGVVKENK
jgi:hypothetical protein